MEGSMTRIPTLIAGFVTTTIVVALVSVSSSAAQPSPACAERRKQAIRLARHINTLQLQQSIGKKAFLPLSELAGVFVPDGFTVQLVHSGAEFVFSIKDTDPGCGVAVFSDQNYLIYTAQPLQ